jgi:Spy/CpxP family protein refolding chaperone
MKRVAWRSSAMVAALAAGVAFAQGAPTDATDMQAMRAAVAKDKRAYVASTLALTDAEAAKFWPVYDAYQRALEQANRRRTVALVDVAGREKLGDLQARQIAKELVAADEDELRARRKLRDRVTDVLPTRKAIRYMQLEWKIRAAQNYDIATTVPLLRP